MNEQGQSQRREATRTYSERRACVGKVRFPSRKNAEGRARAIADGMVSYKCPLCHRWHIGHARWHIA